MHHIMYNIILYLNVGFTSTSSVQKDPFKKIYNIFQQNYNDLRNLYITQDTRSLLILSILLYNFKKYKINNIVSCYLTPI